uniref:H15 domain-containing protein n=1 Tax=Anopheles minimus TaxID=112268 RepID=A0A182WFF9_9DIPT
MAKEVTHSVAKPVETKKITYSDEAGTKTIPTEVNKEPPLITTTAGIQGSSEKPSKKTYEQMIIDAIAENDPRRKGISFTLIKKFIKGRYQIESEITSYVKKAFEKLIIKEAVERVSGVTGMNGSIRLTKAHIESVKKQQKLTAKQKPKPTKQTKVPPGTKPKKEVSEKKDKNNNDKKKGGKAGKGKPAEKLSTKKTAITKTKIARSGGKVRLSILTVTEPSSSTNAKSSKTKASGSKTTATTKSAKPNGQKKAATKPKPANVRSNGKMV